MQKALNSIIYKDLYPIGYIVVGSRWSSDVTELFLPTRLNQQK
jgi:hypothetical protein